MGNLITIARVVELRNKIAQIDRIATMAIKMTFSKDAVIKESGARQSLIIYDQLLRTAEKLRDLKMSDYLTLKSSIEQTLKKLKGCASKNIAHTHTQENCNSIKSA